MLHLQPKDIGPPPTRTGRACIQCRDRKQKCSGVTARISCIGCIQRKVACSFKQEVKDPRYNPYLRIAPRPIVPAGGSKADAAASILEDPSLLDDQPTLSLRSEVQSVRKQVQQLEARLRKLEGQQDPLSSPEVSTLPGNAGHSPAAQTASPEVVSTSVGPSPTTSRSGQPTKSTATLEGPLKALRDFGGEEPVELELYDPIQGGAVTLEEAQSLVDLFFERCHPSAPFLDVAADRKAWDLQQNSNLLFLNILTVAARYWDRTPGRQTWLHPNYQFLVTLLDLEIARVIFRPRPADLGLATVQAFLVYAHWQPIDTIVAGSRPRSRFSETTAWQSLGLAIRWATSLGLERRAHIPFSASSPTPPTQEDMRAFRTMAYLFESDQYLALSACRPASFGTQQLHASLDRFLASPWVQKTDFRIGALLKVAHAVVENTAPQGAGQSALDSVIRFTDRVLEIERDFIQSDAASCSRDGKDTFGRDFPFTSLRWYRLAFSCTTLSSQQPWQTSGNPFLRSIDCASQIILNLSSSAAGSLRTELNQDGHFQPNPDLINFLTFAIDQHFVVITYSASFLVTAWQKGAIDMDELEVLPLNTSSLNIQVTGQRQSLLYRLVHLAATALDLSSPPEGHLARRYARLLYDTAELVGNEPSCYIPGSLSAPPGRGNESQNLLMYPDDPISFQSDLMTLLMEAGVDIQM